MKNPRKVFHPIENNCNTIELTVHTSCYWVLDLLCVKSLKNGESQPFSLTLNIDPLSLEGKERKLQLKKS